MARKIVENFVTVLFLHEISESKMVFIRLEKWKKIVLFGSNRFYTCYKMIRNAPQTTSDPAVPEHGVSLGFDTQLYQLSNPNTHYPPRTRLERAASSCQLVWHLEGNSPFQDRWVNLHKAPQKFEPGLLDDNVSTAIKKYNIFVFQK